MWTGLRSGYAHSCPNALRFFQNLRYTPEMLSAVMQSMQNEDKTGAEAGREWIVANPSVLDDWLEGVTTFDGKDACRSRKRHLSKTKRFKD